jgi:hypothetical protein
MVLATFVEWVGVSGFVVALLALAVALMALAPITVMIWGGPRLEIIFVRQELRGQATSLMCDLHNPPVEGRFQRFVRREVAAGLGASMLIINLDTGDRLPKALPVLRETELPAQASTSFIVATRPEDGLVFTGKDRRGIRTPLVSGRYECRVAAWASHVNVQASKQFVVDDIDLYWTE